MDSSISAAAAELLVSTNMREKSKRTHRKHTQEDTSVSHLFAREFDVDEMNKETESFHPKAPSTASAASILCCHVSCCCAYLGLFGLGKLVKGKFSQFPFVCEGDCHPSRNQLP